MFETIAFVSTIAFITIFVVLFMVDRNSRRDDKGDQPAP